MAGHDPDAVQKLAEKLSELVGEDVVKHFNQGRNERGELVNEEGLPIIDISEPLSAAASRGTGNALLAEDDRLLPIASVPETVRGHLKQERDRILDLLEEEERQQERREKQTDLEERQEILRKRKEAAAIEKAKLVAAKDIQRKMGKALLRNMAESKAQEGAIIPIPDPVDEVKAKDPRSKKTVAFADLPKGNDERDDKVREPGALDAGLDWGDVTIAKLQPNPTRPSLRLSETLPMKMNVVERVPAGTINTPSSALADSDDESEPGTPSTSNLSDDHVSVEFDSDESPVLESDELDLDFAQHQREIALEYHQKRAKIREEALSAMLSPSHNSDIDERMDIPLDMPSSQSQSKSSISRFRANRMASSFNASIPSASSSTPSDRPIVPASSARILQKSIRTGKLDADGHLIGDSGSEEETEDIQELLELLKKGEIYNLGPDGNYIHTIPPRSTSGVEPAASLSDPAPTDKKPSIHPPLNRPKTSKFNLVRSAGRPSTDPSPPSSGFNSRSHTPTSNVERSSPKSPTTTSSVIERQPAQSVPPVKAVSVGLSPTIIDSPSFAPNATQSSTSQPFSMIIESPSFARPAQTIPTFVSPPSFPPPRSTSRPSRPPTVISSTVRESGGARQSPTSAAAPTEKKISRFLSERM